MSSHTDPIGCVAFGESSEVRAAACRPSTRLRPDREARCIYSALSLHQMFASGANNGVIRLWELSHYSVKTHIAPSGAKGAAPTCLVFEDGSLISGWSDGAMRCHGENGAPFWEVPCTHAGGVYSIAIGPRCACGTHFCLVPQLEGPETLHVWARCPLSRPCVGTQVHCHRWRRLQHPNLGQKQPPSPRTIRRAQSRPLCHRRRN